MRLQRPAITTSLGLALASSALALPATAETVLTVDDDGGADFTQLQAAVDAAGPDDLILVADGLYAPTVVDGKTVRIYGESDATPFSGARVVTLTIRNLAADQVAIVRGLGVPELGGLSGVIAEDCDGTVWLEDLAVRVGDIGVVGLDLDDCASVVVSGSSFRNPDPVGLFGIDVFGGWGLRAVNSTIHAYDSEFSGGTLGFSGGPGGQLTNSFLFASGCEFVGGEGARGSLVPICPDANGGPGGVGLEVLGTSEAVLLDTQPQGGPGGPPGVIDCFFGPSGPPQSVSPSATIDDLGLMFPARSFDLTNPVTSGSPGVLSYTGTPGELCWGVFSLAEGPVYSASFSGSLALAPNLIFAFFGAIPAGGTLDVPVNVTLPAGKAYLIAYEQGLFFSLEDSFVLGTPRASLILGSTP